MLCVYQAIRDLISYAAPPGLDPGRISFKRALEAARDSTTRAALSPCQADPLPRAPVRAAHQARQPQSRPTRPGRTQGMQGRRLRPLSPPQGHRPAGPQGHLQHRPVPDQPADSGATLRKRHCRPAGRWRSCHLLPWACKDHYGKARNATRASGSGRSLPPQPVRLLLKMTAVPSCSDLLGTLQDASMKEEFVEQLAV